MVKNGGKVMNVKFIRVSSANLATVPIVNGQIIVLNDVASVYYDMEGNRYPAWGNATSSIPGLVRLSDNYASSAGAASAGVGASSKAVYDAYSTLVSNTKYSMTTLSNYGDNTVAIGKGKSGLWIISSQSTPSQFYVQLQKDGTSLSTIMDGGSEKYFSPGQLNSSGLLSISIGTTVNVVFIAVNS